MEAQASTFQPEQQTLFDLQELAVVTTGSLSQLRQDKKTTQQMIKDALAANETYRANEEKVKETKKVLLQTKQAIQQQPTVGQLVDKLKDISLQLKEKSQSVSDYVLEYARLSGSDEFEKDGELFTIVKTAKLVKSLQ